MVEAGAIRRSVTVRPLSLLGCSLLLGLAAGDLGAATITAQIRVPNDVAANVTDVVIKFGAAGDSVTKIVDNDGFEKPEENSNPSVKTATRTIKFDKGNLAAGANRSVIVETDGTSTANTILKFSLANGNERAVSRGDDIHNKVVYGGSSGVDFLGVSIAPDQYGYFYQFDRNALFPSSPSAFLITFNSPRAPTSSGVIANTFDSSIDDDLLGPDLDDDMVPENLAGVPGVSPLSWTFDSTSDAMIATYATDAFSVGDRSSILYFTHEDRPEFGPIVNGQDNAFLLDASGGVMFANGVNSPALIPEPAVSWLVLAGLAGLAAPGCRRRPRSG